MLLQLHFTYFQEALFMKNWLSPLPFRFRGFQSPRRGAQTLAKRRRGRGFRPHVENLEDRLVPTITAVGAGPGVPPLLTLLNESGDFVTSFNAYDPGFTGGVNVAMGDVNDDGTLDIITGAGAGGGPHVKVFDGVTFDEFESFFAYDPAFFGGVNVAAADLNFDSFADIITGAGPGGGPHVKVFDGATLAEIDSFFPYDPGFTGGVSVAVGDLNSDGDNDVITGAGAGGGPHVRAFDVFHDVEVASFLAYDPVFTGGVNVGAGDFDGNFHADLVTGPGPGGGPDVRIWTAGPTPILIGEFLALDGLYTGGVRVGSIQNEFTVVDSVVATSQSNAGFVEVYNLGGQVLDTSNFAGAGGGVSVASDESVSHPLLGTPPASAEMPTEGNQSSLGAVMFDVYAWAAANYNNNSRKLEDKALTFTNNGTKPVYPFIRGQNVGKYKDVTGQEYDKLPNGDANDQEYRAYLGYFDDTQKKYYFGLPPGAQITINVPLALWDGARIHYSQDTKYFTTVSQEPGNGVNNPYQYFKKNANGSETLRYIDTDAARVKSINVAKPAVFYYHAAAPHEVASEAPDQLLELSIRDPIQHVLNPGLPDPTKPPNVGYLGPLFNYDNSFVDSVAFPGALEAPKVPLVIDQSRTASFGWIGAPQLFSDFEKAIKNFTSQDPAVNGLGLYFGGQGWNSFYVPDPAMGTKLPATKNIYELSPLGLHNSVYRTGENSTVQHFTMASGGTWYQVDIGSSGTFKQGDNTITGVDSGIMDQLAKGMLTNNPDYFAPGTSITDLQGDTITLSTQARVGRIPLQAPTFIGSQFTGSGTVAGTTLTLTDKDKSLVSSLRPNMLVQTGAGGDLTTIARIADSFDPTKQTTIPLDRTPSPIGTATVFTFSGGVDDYVAQKLLNLWYAWSDYWVAHVTSLKPFDNHTPTVQGGSTVPPTDPKDPLPRALTFPGKDLSNLQPGMTVTDTQGILNPNTTISSVSGTTVQLSQYVKTTANNAAFTFGLPLAITRSGYVPAADKNPLKLDFSSATSAQLAKANQFAPIVYSVMQEWSLIPDLTAGGKPFDSLSFLQDIVGGNIGKLPIGVPNQDTTNLGIMYTNQSKSLERGVYDFLKVDEGEWYPNPGDPTPGAKTGGIAATSNIYNLDPYVWFVHKVLAVSTYAFSLDDDKADVGATGANELQIVIGGITVDNKGTDIGFKNKAEWAAGVPFGPQTSPGTADANSMQINGLSPDLFNFLVPPDNQTPGALVLGPGVQPGTRIMPFGMDSNNHFVKLINPHGPALINPPSGTQTYTFFAPVHATGTINPSTNNKQITNIDKDMIGVLNAITKDSSLLPGALTVIGPGIQEGSGGVSTATGAVGQLPIGIAVGDFNGDGNLDASTANYGPTGGDSVSVLLGTGTGAFSSTTTLALPAGTNPFDIATGKFDGSNNLSIVTGNFNGQSVSVLIGNGDGTFKAPLTLPAKDSANGLHKIQSVTTGDVNTDNNLDIVAASGDGTYTVFLGNGNGTFQALPSKSALTAILGVEIANVDTGTGPKPALIVSAYAAEKIGVLPGNGDGTFKDPIFTLVNGVNNQFLATGDFNKDNKIDVATSNTNSNNVSVLLGNGNGTFSLATTFAVGTKPEGIAVADIDKDGNLDLAVANLGSNTGSILLGTGAGSFGPAQSIASGPLPHGIAIGQFHPSPAALDLVFTNFVGHPSDTVTLVTNKPGTAATRVIKVNSDSVDLDQPLNSSHPAGTFRFKFS